MIHLGIDPGLKGGIAVIDEQGELVQLAPYKPETLLQLLSVDSFGNMVLDRPMHATIEKTQAFPGMGVSGAHNYGVGRGKIEGILMAFLIPYDLVAPSRWHTIVAGAEGKTPKARAWSRAQQLFPNHYQWFFTARGKVHDGLVDAALIAEYGRRQR